MHHRTTSTLAFLGTVAAATLAAALMSGNALAEGPIQDIRPVTGALSRDQVKAELMASRAQLTSYGSEWTLQQQANLQPASGYTREQARADPHEGPAQEARRVHADDAGVRQGSAHRDARVGAQDSEQAEEDDEGRRAEGAAPD